MVVPFGVVIVEPHKPGSILFPFSVASLVVATRGGENIETAMAGRERELPPAKDQSSLQPVPTVVKFFGSHIAEK